MIWGFFLKLVIADRAAIFVDAIYGNPIQFGGFYLVAATIFFAIQIYCDFAGYSVIAVGAAEILGIRLMDNFNAPYLARSVTDFWRRWHVSLTSWFRDYVYIPLGGSRNGKVRKYTNKMAVFLLSGLWHGADLSFVVWGGVNGLYQVAGELLQPVRDGMAAFLHLDRCSLGHKAVNSIGTFLLIDFAWIFFRADSLQAALEVVKSIVTCWNPGVILDGSLYECGLDRRNFWLLLFCIFLLLSADLCKYQGIKIRKVIAKQNYWCRCLVMVVSICAILIFGVWGSGYDASGFIYFQF